MAHGHVDAVTIEIDVLHGRADSEIHSRVLLEECIKSPHEPFCGKVGRHAHNQNVVALRAGQGTRTSAKAVKRLPDERQIGTAGLGERNAAGLTVLAAVAIFGLRRRHSNARVERADWRDNF